MGVLVGHVVRRVGEPNGETGVVVRSISAPIPSISELPEQERAHALNVWQGLPNQITVFWLGGDLVPQRVEYLVSSEVEHVSPRLTYRAGDYGFPLAMIETDGYCDLILRNSAGEQVARIDWLDEKNSRVDDPAAYRARYHRLIDAYFDQAEKTREAELAARSAPATAS